MKKAVLFLVIFCMGIAFGLAQVIESLSAEKTGFLVIAPDRGYLGNEMVRSVYREFEPLYPNSILTFLGAGTRSEEEEQRKPLQSSLSEFKAKGLQDVVVIPLFISSNSFILQRAKGLIQEFQSRTAGLKIRTAAPMAESYLTAQILLDMAKKLSENPEMEQLIVLGSGASNEQQAQGIKRDLEKLIGYVTRRMPFKETKSAVLFTRARGEMRQESTNEFNEMITSAAAQKERALVIPFFVTEWKSTNMMATWPRMKMRLAKAGALYSDEEFTTYPMSKAHPNIALWLKKTAAQYLQVKKDEVGVVLVPHGSTYLLNNLIRQQIEPLEKQYKVEIAWGMADAMIMQDAISRLEKRGVKKIVVLRIFNLSLSFKEKTEYVLGLRETPFTFGMGMIPPQVRSGAVFTTLGGFDAHPRVAEILLERTMEISRNPASETVLLLAHGEGDDEINEFWEGLLSSLAEQIQSKAKVKFQSIKYATLREDWPVKKKVAKANIERIIQEGNRKGDVLLIPARFTGSGQYRDEFKGLEFTLQEKGMSPHPKIARWMEDRVEEALQEFN